MSALTAVIAEKKAELKTLTAKREVLLRQITNLEADAKKLVPPKKKVTTKKAEKKAKA